MIKSVTSLLGSASTPFGRLRKPGGHEMRIGALFGGRTRFEGMAPRLDRPLLILGFTNRSGSHLLGDYLRQTGRFAGLGEFCNHDVVAAMQAEHPVESFPDHIAALAGRVCGKGTQTFGLKVSWDQIAMLLRWNIPAMFTACHVIQIRREDMVAQAVSHSIAHQTGEWSSVQRKEGTGRAPAFQPEEIDRIIAGNALSTEMIRLLAEVSGLPYAEVTYEQIRRAPGLHLARLLPLCGVDLPEWSPQTPRFERQSGTRNAEYIRLYHARIREMIGGPPA